MHTSPRREACLRVLTTPRPQHILSHEGLGGCLSILGGVVVNRFRGLALCGAVVMALAVSALVGVGSSSATVFTDPSGNPLPRYAVFPDDPYLFWMTPMEAAEIHRLETRFTTASFVTSTTETMPVNDPSVKGYVPSSSPPTGNPYKPDRYEPDNKVGQAKLLPIERSQVRTLKRGDVDYVKVTANQGGGFIVVATSGDTEVLLNCLIHWGAGCLSRLKGQFAIAFWDSQTQTLILSRDRFGIVPLAFTHTPAGQLAFASEVKALQAGGFRYVTATDSTGKDTAQLSGSDDQDTFVSHTTSSKLYSTKYLCQADGFARFPEGRVVSIHEGLGDDCGY